MRRSSTVATLMMLLGLISVSLFRFERRLLVAPPSTNSDANDFRQPCSGKVTPSIRNIEDFDWAYCSLDLRPFWSSLGIAEDKFIDSSSLSEAYSVFDDLDRDGNNEWILRLTLRTETGQTTRFILLKHDASTRVWRPLAHLDIAPFHLAPEARVVYNGRASWFLVNEHEKAWGSGLTQENETWYELTDHGLTEVLSFPVEAEADWPTEPPIHQRFKAEVQVIPSDGVRDRVAIVYDSTFTRGRQAPFTIRRTIAFFRDATSRTFRFDPASSEVPESMYGDIYDIARRKFTDDLFAAFTAR